MPVYEYSCRHCGKKFEERETVNAPTKRVCSLCGKPGAKRIPSVPGGCIVKGYRGGQSINEGKKP